MKFPFSRTIHSLQRFADRRAAAGQETQETALRLRRASRAAMRRGRFALLPVAACALLGLSALSGQAQDAPKADAPAPQATPAAPSGPAPGSVTVSGLVDVYFGVNARAPRSATGGPFTTLVTPSGETIGIDNAGRSFDINDRDVSLSLGEVNITRTPGKGFPLGVTATLTFGDTARLVHGTEPGGTSSWQTLQQLYLTYTPHVWNRDIAMDAGIFVTSFGQEVIESSSNDNYSRGFLFQYAIPLYHAGLRVSAPLTNTLSAMAMVTNGWNNIADDNDAKSVHLQLAWKPNAKLTGILNWMGGAEGTGAFGPFLAPKNRGNLTINLFEALGTYQATDKLKLAGEIDYGSIAGDVSGVHASANYLGFAGYARYQWTPQFATALRVEQFEDMPGVGGVGLRLGGGYNKLNSATLTLEYASLRGRLISRLEYRHDHARVPFFGAGSGAVVADQDTIYLSSVYKF
ncbi:MAG TPA: outer membrane beta-barrel protein [Chthonomonadaceae bacterium]|nr:outer membrane beta-barrel protein [Chthonomonadaceae bacterium]